MSKRSPLLILALLVQPASLSLSANDARDYAVEAGLGPIKEGETRIWSSKAVPCAFSGVSIAGNELIEYRACYRLPSQYELHNKVQWIRSRLPAAKAQEIRNAVTGIVDLNAQHLECVPALDGSTVMIEARVNGVRILIKAEDPDETTSEACRRVSILNSLLWSAARNRGE